MQKGNPLKSTPLSASKRALKKKAIARESNKEGDVRRNIDKEFSSLNMELKKWVDNKMYCEYDLSGEYGVGYTHNNGSEFYFDKTDSYFRALASDSNSLDGLNTYLGIADEGVCTTPPPKKTTI